MFTQTYGISAEQDAGRQHVVLVVLLEIVADDQRRRHVDEARADAVHGAVRQEKPLRRPHERRPSEAEGQDSGAEETAEAESLMTEHPNEADRQWSTRQRYAERQRPDPVCTNEHSQLINHSHCIYR